VFWSAQHDSVVSLVPGVEGYSQCLGKSRLHPGCRYSRWYIGTLDSCAGISIFPFEFNFCDRGVAWRAGVSGLECGAGWRMCPQGFRLAVARGQELRAWLLTSPGFQHVAGTWGWQERVFSLSHDDHPWYPLSGRCMESCRRRRREEATSGSESPARSLQ